MASNVQTIRFRRPTNNKSAAQAELTPGEKLKNRHAGLLKDQLRRAQRAPWCPTFSTAFRILLLVRFSGAMYSNIQDCDEVFNFWEPLHYLDRGYGFQTWETSPEYAIRSWAYILFHLFPPKIMGYFLGGDKRPAFFSVRILLAVISSLVEAKFYRTVVDKVNYRAGRYLFFMLLFSVGMWTASTSFLPSSFAMYANTLGFTLALQPPSATNKRRTLFATLAFATGAIVGWPFALAVAIPFVFEELFIYGADRVTPETRTSWMLSRWTRLITCGLVALLLFIPVVALDTLFYGKPTLVPYNILAYNVFSTTRGPALYGTAPTYYYLTNLVLNFNVLLPLALFSLPALALTARIDRKRLGERAAPDQSSPFTLLGLRLAPVYIWLAIMSAQAHKEERFMFPVYPLLCYNAAIALYLMRGWLEVAYVAVTSSPYRASRSMIFSRFTLSVITAASILSISRICAHWDYYHAPMGVVLAFEAEELPRLLNVTGYLPIPEIDANSAEDGGRIDLTPVRDFDLRLCVGKEWHRFPGHYLIPDGVRVDWVKSDFDGMLPGHFRPTPLEAPLVERVSGTRAVPVGLNDMNKEEPSFYVDVSTCDYLIDLDFPDHPTSSLLEPRYAVDIATWDRVHCETFLDTRHSPLFTRALWMPGDRWRQANEYGDYCLLRHRENVARKEAALSVRAAANKAI